MGMRITAPRCEPTLDSHTFCRVSDFLFWPGCRRGEFGRYNAAILWCACNTYFAKIFDTNGGPQLTLGLRALLSVVFVVPQAVNFVTTKIPTVLANIICDVLFAYDDLQICLATY